MIFLFVLTEQIEKIDNISLINEKNNIIEEYRLPYNDYLL